jgi:hypothetical protein
MIRFRIIVQVSSISEDRRLVDLQSASVPLWSLRRYNQHSPTICTMSDSYAEMLQRMLDTVNDSVNASLQLGHVQLAAYPFTRCIICRYIASPDLEKANTAMDDTIKAVNGLSELVTPLQTVTVQRPSGGPQEITITKAAAASFQNILSDLHAHVRRPLGFAQRVLKYDC